MSPSASSSPRRRGRPGYDLQRLLGMSVEVFTRKGYDGTTMEDLAAHLGISKSAIYHHVSGKEKLLELAVDQALDGLEDAAQGTRDLSDVPAIDRLEHLVRESVQVLIEQRPFVALLLRVRGNTKVERRALERRRAFDRYVAELVQEAVDDGAVRAGLDPATAARLLFGMVNSLVEWVRPRDTDKDGLADTLCRIAFHGMRVEEADGSTADGVPASGDRAAKVG